MAFELYNLLSTRYSRILRSFHKQETPDLRFGIIHTNETVHHPRSTVTSGLGHSVTRRAVLWNGVQHCMSVAGDNGAA
jgi:hypothetical protein